MTCCTSFASVQKNSQPCLIFFREAPALSNEHDVIVETPETNENNSEWDEQAVVGTSNQLRNASDAVLDFKVSSGNGTDTDDIASKLRVQETKAQLAAAREGMEREAVKLKEERV